VSEDVGFVEAVAQFPEHGQGSLVAHEGIAVLAELGVSVTEAVPGTCLAFPLAEFLVQRNGLPGAGLSLLVLPQPGVAPADVVGDGGLPAPVARGPEQV
jgi:hypothetical protein